MDGDYGKLWWGGEKQGPDNASLIYYGGDNQYNPKSLLFRNRIIKLSTVVDNYSADALQDWLLALDAMEFEGRKNADITLYINSPGGSVVDGLSIYDTMQHIKSPVATVCTGMAASMASVLLAAGAAGKRYILPNATVMVHQLSQGLQGKLRDTMTGIEYAKKLEDRLLDVYVRHMPLDAEGYITNWGGNPDAERFEEIKPERMKPAVAREWLRKWAAHSDRYMGAEQALAFGLVDRIVQAKDMPHYIADKNH